MPCPSVQASRPRSASLAAFWRSCCGVRSWAVALAGEFCGLPYIHMYNNSDIVTRICRISGMEGGTLLFHMIQE